MQDFLEWVEKVLEESKHNYEKAIIEKDYSYIQDFATLRRLKAEITVYENIMQELKRRLDE